MSKNNKLPDKEEILEQYEELKLKLAVIEYAEHLGKQIMEESEKIQDDPFYQPTPEEKNKFMAEMDKHYKAMQRQQYLRNIWRKTHKVALASSIVLLIFATTFFTVEAVRINVRNLFISAQKEYTEIRLRDQEPQDSEEKPQITWEGAYAPTTVPAGFEIAKVTDGTNTKTIEYKNATGGHIIFQQLGEDGGMNIDTEDAEVENIIIQGSEGLLVNKNELITLVWHNEDYLFLLMIYAAEIDNDAALAIADSVALQE